MHRRFRSENGFLTIELLAAIVIITIAILALMAAYDQAFFSLRSAAKTSSAGLIAENQLELYAALSYDSIGLDSSALATAQSGDPYYSSDENGLNSLGTGTSGSDVTSSSTCDSSSAPQFCPVQTVTGSDGHTYKLETFIRSLVNVTNSDSSTWNEKVVTVIVRDLSKTGSPKVVTMQTGFDKGP